MISLFFVSLVVVASAGETKTDYFIGKWNVEIKGTPGGDSKLIIDLKKDGEELKGTVSSKKDGTVNIKKAEMTDAGLLVRFKHGWFTVELLMKEEDVNHCICKLAGRYDGTSERINATEK